MMPTGECDEGSVIRRYSLVAFAPRGADLQIIRADSKTLSFFEQHPNPNAKKWAQTIREMYRYRCAILHNGSTNINSIEINPKKIDWFCHVAKHLLMRVENLAINALIDKETEVKSFWSGYIIGYLFSSRNHWQANGTLLRNDLITFDWENSNYPELV
jgi:ribosomal protein L24E